MFARQAVFAIWALFLASSVPTVAGESTQDNPWTTMPNPLDLGRSSSLSETTTASTSSLLSQATTTSTSSFLSQTMPTGPSFVTSATSASSKPGQPSMDKGVPYICINGLCLPLPTQTAPGAGAHATQSVCAQPPNIPAPRVPVTMFNFTAKCNAMSASAEDCRVTLDCDTTRGLYPTCEDGECKCLAKPCSRNSMCLQHRQCRDDHDEHVCIPQAGGNNATDGTGTCGCQPRITDCLFKENPHHYCAADFNCTEKHFSLYPQFPHCNTGESRFARGRCECRHFDCAKTGDDQDFEVCKDLIRCDASELGHRPYCNLKYGDHKGKQDGYCTCIP